MGGKEFASTTEHLSILARRMGQQRKRVERYRTVRASPMIRSLSSVYEANYFPKRHATRSANTASFYRGKLRQFEAYLLKRFEQKHPEQLPPPPSVLSIKRLRTETVDGYISARLLDKPDLSPGTLNGDLRVLRALIRFCRKYRYLKRRVLVELLPESPEDPEAWSSVELRSIIQSAGMETGTICGIPADLWWTTLLLTDINIGSRVSALMRLEVSDYDPATGILRRRGKTQKQREAQSDVLAPFVRELVERLIAVNPLRTKLFPWPFDQELKVKVKRYGWNTLRTHYNRILARTGLSLTRKDKFHRIRKSTATFITAVAGLEAARQQMGHSTASVTRSYIDPRKVAQPSVSQYIPWESILPHAG